MRQEATALYAAEEHWQTILESPEYFLHGIDLKNGSLEFVKTTRDILSSASFLDGRSALSTTPASYFLPLDEVVNWQQISEPINRTNRFIFHMSFCGSTLVSRVLDLPGSSISYREPQILLELAEIKAAGVDWYRDKQRWQSLVKFVSSQHSKQWAPGEEVIIKPSNWANSMLPQLVEDGGHSRAIFLGISAAAFLTSVFRGGGERIQFTYALLKHLTTAFPEFSTVVSEVESSRISSPDMFARLTLVVHAMQCKAFQRVSQTRSLDGWYAFTYDHLLAHPTECLNEVIIALDLTVTGTQLNSSIDKNFTQHSKVTNRTYNLDDAVTVDQQVLTTYHETFARTFEWAEKNLDPSRFN